MLGPRYVVSGPCGRSHVPSQAESPVLDLLISIEIPSRRPLFAQTRYHERKHVPLLLKIRRYPTAFMRLSQPILPRQDAMNSELLHMNSYTCRSDRDIKE